MTADVNAKITEIVTTQPVVLFMKGSRRFPQCGFSSRVVSILDRYLPRYETVNVLTDPALREGIKAFSQWPTIPQLYVRGKFVGGCDIVTEMAESGELEALLGDLAVPADPKAPPKITISKAAAEAFRGAAESPNEHPRLVIGPQFQYELYFDTKQADDLTVTSEGITLLVDPESARRAEGMAIDFVDAEGGGFKMDNPNEPPKVKNVSPQDMKAMRDKGERFELLDVRTPGERALAKLDGDRVLDEVTFDALVAMPKDTPLVFYCHHGHRSRSVANQFLSQGFTRVYNLEGGIDAWSRIVDPKVPTY